VLQKKFTQKQLITFTSNMQISLIGMEACSGAHFLGRVLRQLLLNLVISVQLDSNVVLSIATLEQVVVGSKRAEHAPVVILALLEPQRILENVFRIPF
jgi:hypothetical protein